VQCATGSGALLQVPGSKLHGEDPEQQGQTGQQCSAERGQTQRTLPMTAVASSATLRMLRSLCTLLSLFLHFVAADRWHKLLLRCRGFAPCSHSLPAMSLRRLSSWLSPSQAGFAGIPNLLHPKDWQALARDAVAK